MQTVKATHLKLPKQNLPHTTCIPFFIIDTGTCLACMFMNHCLLKLSGLNFHAICRLHRSGCYHLKCKETIRWAKFSIRTIVQFSRADLCIFGNCTP